MIGIARARYREEIKSEIKKSVRSMNIDFDRLLRTLINFETSLTSELEKVLRDVPKEVSSPIIKKAEFIDRIDDIEEDLLTKKAAINFFGEQGEKEILPILKELKEEEEIHQIITAITKAIHRIIERMREPNFSESESQGYFNADRRPWRAMIRITQVKNENLRVVLPGWNSTEEIQLVKNTFPKELHQFLSPGERFFAKVNIGADDQSELYFTDFEKKP